MSKYFTVKRLAVLALLTALCHIGRIAFQFIPNVQPVTVILIIITLTMGTLDGLLVAITSMVISNMLLGMGPWTLYQIMAYGIIVLLTSALKALYNRLKDHQSARRVIFALFAGATGLIYGFVISLFSSQMFGVVNFWVYYAQGITFDLMHAAGNVAFFLVLEPTLVPIIQKRFITSKG
ncbi:MAG: ECF transporter S component [Ruoffia tabacinasalis]|uniref:ECF transporter S component n=1 Tax=unclassified Ruoffia TaxID=2862149 RepID=UPI000EBBBA19|nr:ECF transporter S component [Aerococcaceae bacterium]